MTCHTRVRLSEREGRNMGTTRDTDLEGLMDSLALMGALRLGPAGAGERERPRGLATMFGWGRERREGARGEKDQVETRSRNGSFKLVKAAAESPSSSLLVPWLMFLWLPDWAHLSNKTSIMTMLAGSHCQSRPTPRFLSESGPAKRSSWTKRAQDRTMSSLIIRKTRKQALKRRLSAREMPRCYPPLCSSRRRSSRS